MNETATATDRWTAAACRVSRRLFEVCGEAGAAGVDAEAAIALTSIAGQSAWHAELFFDLLPVRVGIDRAALVDEELAGADDALGVLSAAAARGEIATACLVLARVVIPRLIAAVAEASASTDPRLDGPRARALTLVGRDLADSHTSIERVAERLVAAAGALDEGVATCLEAERRILDAQLAVGLWRADVGPGGLTPPVE